MPKTHYFTKNNILAKSVEMLLDVNNSVHLRVKPVMPDKSALLVVDMQKYFTDKHSKAFIPSSEAIISNINCLIDLFKGYDRPVIFTKHVNNEQNIGLIADWWQDTTKPVEESFELAPLLDASDALIVEKAQYDAFYGTNPEDVLHENDVQQLFITGVMTHICCETTARSAFVRKFQPFMVVDATATQNEDFHRSSMLNLGHSCCALTLTQNVIGEFGG